VFKDLCALIKTQHATTVKILRSDNGTEYVNQDFDKFLALNGIEHQTTCVNTPEQNGVAERKNRHLLEVARSLMFTMHVPKFLWSEAIKTATYLINRMPLRVLGYRTPTECLFGSNDFVVPPKVFGCVCFVHDYRNSVGKLDPRALKCVFTGYPLSKKGYRCWCPSERRFFESSDVTFREYEPYYGSSCDSGIDLLPLEGQQEGENGSSSLIPIRVPPSSGTTGPLIHDNMSSLENNLSSSNDTSQGEETHHDGPDSESFPGDTMDATGHSSLPSEDEESIMHKDPGTDCTYPNSTTPISTGGQGDNQISTVNPQANLPIALRKPARTRATPGHLKDFVGYRHNIANFISYQHCSPTFQSFIASLDSVSIPSYWKVALEDPKWREAMLDEMRALEKNETWELVDLPQGKQSVGC
jgi:hypothetical protein